MDVIVAVHIYADAQAVLDSHTIFPLYLGRWACSMLICIVLAAMILQKHRERGINSLGGLGKSCHMGYNESGCKNAQMLVK